MTWLKNFNIYIQGTIIVSIIVGLIVIITTALYIFKPQAKRKSIKYIYAFSSGFILITAVIGLFVESRHKLNAWRAKSSLNDTLEIIISLLVVVLGIILGVLIALFIRKFFSKYNVHQHSNSHIHASTIDNEYESIIHSKLNFKISGIFMILSHRLPAGMAIGTLLASANKNNDTLFAYVGLAAIILHIIPELMIIFYGMIDSGQTKFRTLVYSLLIKLILIPGVFMGIVIGDSLDLSSSLFWIMPFIYMVVGTLMIWAIFSELIPEFLHNKNDSQVIIKMLLVFMLGVVCSLLIQMIPVH